MPQKIPDRKSVWKLYKSRGYKPVKIANKLVVPLHYVLKVIQIFAKNNNSLKGDK